VAAIVLLVLGAMLWHWETNRRKDDLRKRIEHAATALAHTVGLHFLTQSCTQCQEADMMLLEVSPNARSVHYQCRNCSKTMWAAAGSPTASTAAQQWAHFTRLLSTWNQRYPRMAGRVWFRTPESPLPYEMTGREPIPAAVKSEIWRRDQGRCTACGSKQQLEIDHIIPVSRGGATTTTNLQILCKGCNRTKAARI